MNPVTSKIYLLINAITKNNFFHTTFLVSVNYDAGMNHCNGPKIKA